MTSLLEELEERGFIESVTDPKLGEMLEKRSFTLYCGFDPTADSLHIGSLMPLMGLKHFQLAGHKPIVVIGGGTGMVGDPSGKSKERNLLTEKEISRNIEGLEPQIKKFLDFDDAKNGAIYINNADWLNNWRVDDWLRNVGTYFSLSTMIAKESVKSRLDSKSGISFAEFSYQILQAYDFFHLYEKYNCKLQVGGGDQWGNIVAGIDFIHRKLGRKHQAYGIGFPLLLSNSGMKFGKSEAGNIWLDADRTSYYDFYQYFIRTDDRDVIKYLKLFVQ